MDDLAGMITGTAWGTTYNAHGNFVLMSAGEDRVYGPNVGPGRSARNAPNKKGPKTWDDIVIVH